MIGAPVFRYVLTPGWAGDSLALAAQAVPSLDLNFAVTKNLGPLVTFTRASSATFIDSAGTLQTAAVDVPRFDHNPTTGESLGLLVEEARTNLLVRSEEFNDASWNSISGARTVTANSIAAPDGSTTADTITADGTSNAHFVSQAVTLSAVSYSFSVFAKAGTETVLAIRAFSAFGGAFVIFNLSTGVVSSFGSGGSGTITPYLNGWYRCTMVFTPLAASSSIGIYLRDITANIASTNLYLWGAQLEAGAFPTSYIPTTTAAATRSADVASITTVGSNIRSLFAQFRSPASGTRPVASLDDNTANERIEILTSGTDPKLLVTYGGSAVADLNGGTVTANVTAKAAAVFDTNSYAFSVNGGASQLDSSGTLPTVNRIRIGSNQAGVYLNSTIARATGWDVALPNLPPITQ
jgi:hypothetical protein